MTKILLSGLTAGLALTGVLLGGTGERACAAAKSDTRAEVFGTIVSVRGNILVIRPSLRPKLTRVAVDGHTKILGSARAGLALLKPGMRIGVRGRYTEKEGFSPRWIEASETPVGFLAEKSTGLRIDKEHGWASGVGNVKSVTPFVFTDDAGKEYSAKLDKLQGVWHDYPIDRSGLLIGARIDVEGIQAADGVIQADTIFQDRNFAKTGTMFGTIIAVKGNVLQVRPRYSTETIAVTCTPQCRLQRQISLDPDRIRVGQTVTFWGQQRNHAWDRPRSSDLLAIALLVGSQRYPASEGDDAPVFLTGKIASLDPVTLTLPGGATINVIIPGQMPIARLETAHLGDLKPGREAMIVLSRNADGGFQTSTVVLDAPPWVGYGG